MTAVSVHVWGVRSSNPQATPFTVIASQVARQLFVRPQVPLAPPLLIVSRSSAISEPRRTSETVPLPVPPSPVGLASSTSPSARRPHLLLPIGTSGFAAARPKKLVDDGQSVLAHSSVAASSSGGGPVHAIDAGNRPYPVEPDVDDALAAATDEPARGPSASKAAERTEPGSGVKEQEHVVRAVLDQYTRSYDRLDVRATKAVYPSVDDVQLQRLFNGLEEQRVRFASCKMAISGETANAQCLGDAIYRPKIGSGVKRLKNREWTFHLARDGGEWQILNARMQ